MKLRTHVGLAALVLAFAAPALAQTPANTPNPDHPGKGAFDRTCSFCHSATPADPRAPAFASLTAMSAETLAASMAEGGKMAPMAAALTPEDRTSLVAYLISGQPKTTAAADWTAALMCEASNRKVDVTKPIVANGFGGDAAGSRRFTAAQAGLKTADMSKLKVSWTIGVPNTTGLGVGTATLGDTAFTAMGGYVVAMDAKLGCFRWTNRISTRNTPAFGKVGDKTVLAFSSGRDIVTLDAATGEQVWRKPGIATMTGNQSIRGGVTFYKDKIFVPISSSGITGTAAGGECCTGHGAVVALAAADGAKLWEYHTMPDATYNGKVNKNGAKQKGPSGAPIWSVPAIDEARNRVIVTTGENTSHPATDTSDAVIAIDMDTGKMVWQFQAMEHDVWNMQCRTNKEDSGVGCPWTIEGDSGLGRDFDFGAGAVIVKASNGKDIVLAGQKSGHIWALDAVNGKQLWSHQIGKGTALGGIHWGVTTDGRHVFAANNDPIAGGGELKPGMFAFDLITGKPAWEYNAKADCPEARKPNVVNCDLKFGFSAAPIVVDGAVIAATLDAKVFVFDAAKGTILKQFDFAGPQTTKNGVAGKGGSVDAHAISVSNGTIVIGAGYGSFNQTPGNAVIGLSAQ